MSKISTDVYVHVMNLVHTMYRRVHTCLYLPLVLDTRCYLSLPTAQFHRPQQSRYDLYRLEPACQLFPHCLKTGTMYIHFAYTAWVYVHVHRVYVHVHTLYMGTTDCLHIPLQYIPSCTALVIWMYYAIIQESAVWYIQVSERDIPFKVWLHQV